MTALLFGLFLSSTAAAFETLPMYNHLATDEHLTLEGADLVDSEYASDFLAYSKPIEWDLLFAEKKHFFDLTLGSLNGTRFLTNHRLKTSGALTEKLDFSLYYFDQSNLEDTNQRLILELDYKLSRLLSIAIYGEPQAQKSDNDVGLAFIIRPTSAHSLRLYHTWIDPTFNKRGEGTDTYNQLPRAIGFSGVQDSRTRVEYHTRFEPLSERSIPGENKVYFHRRFYAGVKVFRMPFYLAIDGGNKLERNTFTTGPSGGVDEWERDHLDLLFKYHHGPWRYGGAYRYRYWKSNLGSVTHNEFIPLLNYV